MSYAGEKSGRRRFNSASDVVTAWMNESGGTDKRCSVANYQNVGFAVATGKLSGEDTVFSSRNAWKYKFGSTGCVREQ